MEIYFIVLTKQQTQLIHALHLDVIPKRNFVDVNKW